MPHNIPWTVRTRYHPGSSSQEINSEPDWKSAQLHEHRVGFRDRYNRLPGLTHDGDEAREEDAFDNNARAKHEALKQRAERGELINFRDIVRNEQDRSLKYPHKRPLGWRFVLPETEDWVKQTQEWPANVEKRDKEEAGANKQNQPQNSSLGKNSNSPSAKPRLEAQA
jgi:nitrate reductase (NAD(P)H)